jgi:hypothetical protein
MELNLSGVHMFSIESVVYRFQHNPPPNLDFPFFIDIFLFEKCCSFFLFFFFLALFLADFRPQ